MKNLAKEVLKKSPQQAPLTKVLNEISEDASQNPQSYLEDTKVPEGGE